MTSNGYADIVRDSTILIVDDKLENVVLLEAILEDEGYQDVISLTDPREVTEALAQSPSALLLDMRMPHMSGLEVIASVQHYYRQRYGDDADALTPPIMVLTADNDEQLKLAALELGAQDYLTKPFNQFEVTQRLANLLLKHRMSREQRRYSSQLQAQVAQQNDALRHLAHTDPATGLGNRRYIATQLENDLARAEPFHLLAIAILGIDDISRIRGQQTADKLQQAVAEGLRSIISGEVGWVGHYDSHMFMMRLCPQQHSIEATTGAIQQLVNRTVARLLRGRVQARIGVYRYHGEAANAQQVLRYAIQAVPRHHDSSVGEYSEALSEAEARQYHLKLDLPHLDFDNGLFLVMQPKYDLQAQRYVGAEALLRWQHDELGLISPLEFIGLAEDTGDIRDIGDRVVMEAMRMRSTWHQNGDVEETFDVAVNVAAQQLVDGFADFFIGCLDRFQLPPSSMSIEVTESGIAESVATAYAELERLRQHGIKVAIDDFGTGYSSLQYIKELPADWIKIDRSFIVDLLQGERDQFLVQSVVSLARGLGYGVVAEGVEHETEASWLHQNGCQLAQGYYFAKPLTESAFLQMFQRSVASR